MICYKDMTFCPHFTHCKDGYKCKRALTFKVKMDAARWWDSFNKPDIEPPIAYYTDYPDCYIGYKKVDK